MAGRKGYGGRTDGREILFLVNYYDPESKTKGSGLESARAAGYPESFAKTAWPKILRKFGDAGFKDSLRAVGITKPYLALKIRYILEEGTVRDMVPAIRMALAAYGESTDQSQGTNQNVFTGPVMLIQGMTQEKLKALRCATPQLTREQLEEESNKRGAAKLEMLKRGELPPLEKNPETGYIYRKPLEVEIVEAQAVSNLNVHDAEPSGEAPAQ